MNEFIVSNSDTKYLSGSNGYTAKILDALDRAKNEFVYIGFLLCEVDNFQYYREAGFANIYDYCEVTFGFKRSSTNNFMRVYRKFGDHLGLQDRFRGYSYSQLTEMCSMNDSQLSECSSSMSVQRLRDIKRSSVVLVDPVASPVDTVASPVDSVQTSGFSTFTLSEGLANRLRELGYVSSASICAFIVSLIDRGLGSPVSLVPDYDISDMGTCPKCRNLCSYDDDYCSSCGSSILHPS